MPAILSAFQQPSNDLNVLLYAPTGANNETVPRWAANSTSSASLATGTVYAHALGFRAGTKISNVTVATGAQAATQLDITHAWCGIMDQNLLVQAVSADQAGAAYCTATNTEYTLAMAAPYITTYAGYYYLFWMMAISAGSMPELITHSTPPASSTVDSSAPVLFGTSSAGQTTPPTPGTTSLAAVSFSASNAFYAYTS